MTSSAFDLLPEELTEQILSLCVTASSEPPSPRPNWLPTPASKSLTRDRRTSVIRTRLAPLLVCKEFYRISIPHYHSTVHIISPEQAAAFLHTLQLHPHLVGPCVRRCVSSEIYPMLVDSAAEDFCNALHTLQNVRHLTLRKASSTYLTLPRIRHVLTELATAIEDWNSLESANVAFRMSDDNPLALLALAYPSASPGLFSPVPTPTPSPLSPTLPSSNGPSYSARVGPMSLLTSALAKSPSLHTFSTHVPNVWNDTLLRVSQNPCLQKIILSPSVMITGLFMNEAKKHTRLTELIKAGTPMVRSRAQTLGNFGISAPTALNAHGYNGGGSSAPVARSNAKACSSAGTDRVRPPTRSNSIMTLSSSTPL
ncbi:hypothetical protein BDP27DRAFT_1335878 [Rhodocollybia butyracea]|uniref:Uncharacterized protein n=1 Tax=Rhodocollybia butyracea TaxID=206335 RepID=A0A9P5PD88_9AGAR|nr:hypothetical protein BDP27DRAFT_1335878 [Rhodocollybia butyracea]